ncbi:hypothetical protein [Halobacillus litoralis]|uniref:hypothetical protein n=1 Tax=Halobacillus litoralis TaxID=45668 RepID=UPI0013E8BECA|nr:hypothetical protein [Halobacillus litoralis]
MEIHLDFVILAVCLALAGYFIGNGLRNFGKSNPVDDYLDQSIKERLTKGEERQ